jgi:hypothetical protein
MKRSSILVAAALLVSLAGMSFGATYYVATTGNDTWPGTQAQPWATLQKAVDTIAAGDTILVQPGTYAGCRMRYGGTAVAPKTLMAQTAGTVLVNAPGALTHRNSDIEVQSDDFGATPTPYWVIDGFEVASAPAWGIDGIRADNLVVRNCTVHNNGA